LYSTGTVCRELCKQESRAVAANYRAMRGTCIESLHLIIGQRSEEKQHQNYRETWEVVKNDSTCAYITFAVVHLLSKKGSTEMRDMKQRYNQK